jgi:hypothetical protein
MTNDELQKRLAEIETKRGQLKAREQDALTQLANAERKAETRRKIIAGGWMLSRLQSMTEQTRITFLKTIKDTDAGLFPDLFTKSEIDAANERARIAKEKAKEERNRMGALKKAT